MSLPPLDIHGKLACAFGLREAQDVPASRGLAGKPGHVCVRARGFTADLWRSERASVSFPGSLLLMNLLGVTNVLYRLGWWGPGDACASLCPCLGCVGPMAPAVATHRRAARASRRPHLQADRVGKTCRLESRIAGRPIGSAVHACRAYLNGPWTRCWSKSGATRRRSSWRATSHRTIWPGRSRLISGYPAAATRGRRSVVGDGTEMPIRRMPEEQF